MNVAEENLQNEKNPIALTNFAEYLWRYNQLSDMTKSLKNVFVLILAVLFMSSCASTTIIQSNPSGAKLYLNGEPVGRTPYTHRDTKIVGSTTDVKLELEGYRPLFTSFTRDEEVDVGAIVAGIFVYVPFLWTMKYKPNHLYELIPFDDASDSEIQLPARLHGGSNLEKLRELKQMLDENLITKEEYDRLKKKILGE